MTIQPTNPKRKRRETRQDKTDERKRRRTNRRLMREFTDRMTQRLAEKADILLHIEPVVWDEAVATDQGNEEI